MKRKLFRGTGVALITPFKKDGSVDERRIRELVEFQITNGTEAILPAGTTGESATLSHAEHHQVMEIVLDQTNHRLPIIVGAGSNSTREAISLTVHAKSIGADGVLSVAPYYNKPTQEGFYQHYAAIAETVDIPIVVYNVPGRTGSNIAAETTLRMAEEIPNVVAVKEASGNISQIMEILRGRPEDFSVYSGDDQIAFAVVALGGDGIISVVANQVPRLFSDMIRFCLAGDLENARELHYKLLPLMNVNFIESNPIPVKASLAMMGMIEEVYRLPLVPPTNSTREKLKKILSDLELIQVPVQKGSIWTGL
ncbi:MAG: 4-hydroxy-tetrahydrodipicolinate synthase [Bacteroidetes bacterium]|nr:4-hydroxy-tetrahydrodipicolinate synthase [Bacteroidota bacterium]MCL5738711.1 4-hydroxy-tetrahydrodipicolinate synthase [Bacteroidota bacterium]